MSDIVVLGGGPGGYAVALRAVARGQSVTVIEADKVGGTCLHWGCIPSKAMLYVGGLLDEVHDAKRVGLDLAVNDVSVAGINAFREKVQNNLYKGLSSLMKGKGIEVVNGHGTVADDGRTVLVDGATTSRHTAGTALVLATGSKVRSLPGVDVDRTVVITSDEATRLPRIPRRALVIGSGAVGLEFASLWRSLGAEEVTVVEALDRIAPLEDPDLSKQLARNYRKRGITTVAGAMVESVKVEGDTATVRFGDREVTVDTVLVAVGRAPRTDGIGLEQLGVVNDRGYIEVDQWQRTSAEGVYAVGDLLPPPALALAHAGFAEGFLAADVIAQDGDPQPIDYAQVPRVTYTSPEVASVGLTEPQAKERVGEVVSTQYSFRGNAKGIIHESDGFVKVVAKQGGEVLGVHVIGPHATDLIAEAQLITAWGALPSEVAALVHPHPTLAEAMGEAHLAAAGTPFHTH